MPKDVTVTFKDGTTHVYKNAPDNISPDDVEARAQKDFGKEVASLSRGAPAAKGNQADASQRTLGGDMKNALLKLGRDLGGSIPFVDQPGQYKPNALALVGDVGGLIQPPVQAAMRPVASGLESMGIHAYKGDGGPTDFRYRQMTTDQHADELANDAVTAVGLLAPARPRGTPLINTPPYQPPPRPAPRPVPVRTQRVRALQAAGVDLTPGQMAGGILQNLEDATATTSGAVREAKIRGNEALNNVVMNDAVSPIGGHVDGAGRNAVESMHTQVSDALNNAFGNARFVPDAQMQADVQNAARGLLPSSRGEAHQIAQEFIDDATTPDGLSEAFARLTRQRGQATAQGNHSLANFIHDLQQSTLDTMERSGTDTQAIRNARDAFRRSVVPERAAALTGAQDGVFSPEQLRTAVKASDRTVRKNAYAQGNAQYQDLSDAAVDVMGKSIGSSGTAERAMLSDPVKFAVTTARNLALRGVYNRPVIGLLNRISQAQTPQALSNGLNGLRSLASRNPEAAEALRLLTASGGQGGAAVGQGLGAVAAPSQSQEKRPKRK